jgi:hypothetical protein
MSKQRAKSARWTCNDRQLFAMTDVFVMGGHCKAFPEELCCCGTNSISRSARPGPMRALWQFRRGFVEVVHLSAELWLRHADELTRRQPIREVQLTTRPEAESRSEPENSSLYCRISWRDWCQTSVLSTPLTQSKSTRVYLKDLRLRGESWGTQDDVIQAVLSEYWPRIQFTLPPLPASRPLTSLARQRH